MQREAQRLYPERMHTPSNCTIEDLVHYVKFAGKLRSPHELLTPDKSAAKNIDERSESVTAEGFSSSWNLPGQVRNRTCSSEHGQCVLALTHYCLVVVSVLSWVRACGTRRLIEPQV